MSIFMLIWLIGCSERGHSRASMKAQGDVGCRPVSPPAGELLVDDFEDGDLELASVGILQGTWYVNNDGTGSQDPEPSDARASPSLVAIDSTESPTWALHTSGDGFTLWGAFAAARLNAVGSHTCDVDLSGHRSLSLRAKGEGSLRINLGTRATTPVVDGGNCSTDACSDYGISVPLSPEWRELALSLDDWTQPEWADPAAFEPAAALRLSFWAEGSHFDFWVDDLRFFP